jgi:putative protease
MELLAPAGTNENFHAAIEAGADAVYVGAPGFNARNLARDLRLEEIGAMIRVCHERGKKLYVAANSLVLERELPQLLEMLALLDHLVPDALIVQDLGIIRLVRRYFPRLKLHASTLMTAASSQAAGFLAALGCERVVLARELTVREIAMIRNRVDVELEVFVHGAMCFSYSGLCLFSSFLGGRSGLRGRCVQPCRRAYAVTGKGRGVAGGKGGGSYLFSMNDLSGLSAVPILKEIGVASLKLEGRQRSAHYVQSVVSAYRLILDAAADDMEDARAAAEEMVRKAMSRKVTTGYFFSPQPQDAITPHHSGNIGLHLGRAGAFDGREGAVRCTLTLKEDLAVGDRLRLHLEPSGERLAFTLKEMFSGQKAIAAAPAGAAVRVALPPDCRPGKGQFIELYKVDIASVEQARVGQLPVAEVKKDLDGCRRSLAHRLQRIVRDVMPPPAEKGEKLPQADSRRPSRRGQPQAGSGIGIEWWLQTDSLKSLQAALSADPDRLVLSFEKDLLSQAGQIRRMLGNRARNVIWSLPAVIHEQDLGKYGKQIQILLRSGFRSFQISHVCQASFFTGERVHLFGDFTLNLLNSQAVRAAEATGLQAVQLCIEADRANLGDLIRGYRGTFAESSKGGEGRRLRLGLTVYGSPALYTARLAAQHFPCDKPILSPKGEAFVIRRKDGYTQTHSVKPFSLLPYLRELKGMGLDYAVVDIRGERADNRVVAELRERLAGIGRYPKLPTFNYLGRLE